MNKRIQQLAEQCTSFHTDYDFEHGYSDVEYFDKEKFAELIVRECMAVAKYHTPDIEACEHTWLIHDKIKEHFGVEE